MELSGPITGSGALSNYNGHPQVRVRCSAVNLSRYYLQRQETYSRGYITDHERSMSNVIR